MYICRDTLISNEKVRTWYKMVVEMICLGQEKLTMKQLPPRKQKRNMQTYSFIWPLLDNPKDVNIFYRCILILWKFYQKDYQARYFACSVLSFIPGPLILQVIICIACNKYFPFYQTNIIAIFISFIIEFPNRIYVFLYVCIFITIIQQKMTKKRQKQLIDCVNWTKFQVKHRMSTLKDIIDGY